MRLRISGAWRDVSSGIIHIGSQWRRLTQIRIYIDGEWRTTKQFVAPLSASASPSEVFGFSNGGTTATDPTTVTPAGGTSPYTYAWARISGEGSINSPTSATTRFRASLGSNDDKSGVFRCTVTEAGGNTASATASASFASFDLN